MPEFPDITLYIESLLVRIRGQVLRDVRLRGPFLLRTATPPLAEVKGRRVAAIRRLGKRIAIGLEGELWLVLHSMIAGRLHWRPPGAPLTSKNALMAADFDAGTLVLTEAGSKRRASLHLAEGEAALASHDPGGLEVLEAGLTDFADRLSAANRTLKRALTDPHLFSGIGNAYSDEILHRARLSPVAMTRSLPPGEVQRLFDAIRDTLNLWVNRLRAETGDGFPAKVTAFRPGMAVHGRYGEACPDCGASVQRIRYAKNEVNYCARCQTGGKLLADRALSRLLKKDWPRTIEELEQRVGNGRRN